MDDSIVIIGAGQAGFQVAASLRQARHSGPITLVGDEAHPPYQRPPLSKAYLKSGVPLDEVHFRPDGFYRDADIRLEQHRATRIDRNARCVELNDGQHLGYDHLVLATGARTRRLTVSGADLPGVFQLRTLDDADRIAAHLRRARQVVAIGAGFIGLECAVAAHGAGCDVHVVELGDGLMARTVSREMSEVFRRTHETAGIAFHLGRGVARLHASGAGVEAVELDSGETLPADMVVLGVGVAPNDDIARDAGLAVADGICVNRDLLTSDPYISAIGDCARFPGPTGGPDPVRLECVQNAVDQARHVAARLTGSREDYAALPWFWTEQGPLKLQIVGLSEGHDQSVRLGGPDETRFSLLLFRDGLLVAVESLNSPADFMASKKILQSGVLPRLEEAQGPDFTLRAWAKAPGPRHLRETV